MKRWFRQKRINIRSRRLAGLRAGATEMSVLVTDSLRWFFTFSASSYLYPGWTKWFTVSRLPSDRCTSRSHSSECQVTGEYFQRLLLLLGSWCVTQNTWAPVLSKMLCYVKVPQTHISDFRKSAISSTQEPCLIGKQQSSHPPWECGTLSIIPES